MSPARLRLTAFIGLLGILLGAMGAHGHVHNVLLGNGNTAHWQTAVHYHQIHAVALLALSLLATDAAGVKRFRLSFIAFTAGILIFSGSLYVLAYASIKWLGAVTPIGGVALMIGWASLGLGLAKKQQAPHA